MPTKAQQACSILDLQGLPSKEELKSAYKTQIKKWHPDQFHCDKEMERIALARTKQINAAYQRLLKLIITKPRFPQRRTNLHRNTKFNTFLFHLRNRTTGFPDPEIIELFVHSAQIVSAGYDQEKQILYLKFPEDDIHVYYGVPYPVFAAFMFSKSPDNFARKHIYPQFKHQQSKP